MSRVAPEDAAPGGAFVEGRLLRTLTATARELAGEVPGPLRRVSVQLDGARVDLEWEDGARDETDVVPVAAALAVARLPAELPAERPAEPGAERPVEPDAEPPAEPDAGTAVRSPIVGTFYRCQAPGEPEFVAVGDTVDPDSVIGIVEAMKLMNPITAGQHGVVVAVLVADGSPVEFDQPLVTLGPAADVDREEQ